MSSSTAPARWPISIKSMGGDVFYAGKPYAPIYQRTLARAQSLRGGEVPLHRVLAIGDSVRTDLTGAASLGVDCLFLTAGIHAGEIGGGPTPIRRRSRCFSRKTAMPKAVMHRLVW